MFKIFFLCLGNLIKKLFAIASAKDRDFRNLLYAKNMSIVFKTGNNGEAVQYKLKNGDFYVDGDNAPDAHPDVSVTFSSAADACLMVLKPTPKKLVESFTDAFMNDNLNIEFDAEPLVWFLTTIQKALGVLGKKTKKKNKKF